MYHKFLFAHEKPPQACMPDLVAHSTRCTLSCHPRDSLLVKTL